MCFLSKVFLVVVTFLTFAGCKKHGVDANAVVISGISPSSGPRNSTLMITGVNFSPTVSDNQVYINGHRAVVTAASPTSLTVVVPPKAGTGNVEVKKGGETAKGPVFTYQYNYYTVTTLAGSVDGYKDGKGADAQFGTVEGLAVDGDGNVIVADFGNNVIRKVQQDGTVTTLAGNAGMPGGYKDGPASGALFNSPFHVVVGKDNTIYVTDRDNHNIRKLQYGAWGYTVSTLAGSTSGQAGFVDGTGANARFHYPTGLAIDTVGSLYVYDAGNYAVRKVTIGNASVVTLAGTGATGYANGYGATAAFSAGGAPAASRKGDYLLLGDFWNNNIRKLSPLTTANETLVSTEIGATPGIAGHVDGGYSDAKLNGPVDIALDEAHAHLFIADDFNHCVRIVDMVTHTVSTLVGDPAKRGVDDGDLSKATFDTPLCIAADREGNLYIFDDRYGNPHLRRIAYE